MDPMTSALSLRTVVRYRRKLAWPRFWREELLTIAWQEFLIDGRTLPEVFGLSADVRPAETTALRSGNAAGAVEQLERLLGTAGPDFDDHRVALLVCGGCLQAACGALSVHLTRTDNTVHWSSPAWQDETGREPRPVAGPSQIVFDRQYYEAVITRTLRLWQGGQSSTSPDGGLISYPVLAIDEDGGVHLLASRSALEGIGELFIHGEVTQLVDAGGTEYAYREGNLPYLELTSTRQADPAALLRLVQAWAEALAVPTDRHDGTSDLRQAFDLARTLS
jgi:hypothetical protein